MEEWDRVGLFRFAILHPYLTPAHLPKSPSPIHPRDHLGIGPFKKIWQHSISQRRDTVPKCWQWGGWCYLTGWKVTLSLRPWSLSGPGPRGPAGGEVTQTTCTPREAGLSCYWLVLLSEHKSHVNPQRKQAKQEPLAESREEPNRLFLPFSTTAASKGEGNSKLSIELTHTLSYAPWRFYSKFTKGNMPSGRSRAAQKCCGWGLNKHFLHDSQGLTRRVKEDKEERPYTVNISKSSAIHTSFQPWKYIITWVCTQCWLIPWG